MRNLANICVLNQYLRDHFPGLEIGELMVQALSLPLRKENSISRRLTMMPAHPEPWLTPAIFHSRTLFEFRSELLEAQPHLVRAVQLVRDWIAISDLKDAEWLAERTDKGAVLRLRRIGTLSQAVRMAEKDLRNMAYIMDVPLVSLSDFFVASEGRVEEIVTLPNGWRWVELVDAPAIRREGLRMRNCLKAVEYADTLPEFARLYSLRNAENESLLTARAERGKLVQCLGRGNAPADGPWTLYVALLQEWLQDERKWCGKVPTFRLAERSPPDPVVLAPTT